jgi:hypothetical protein
MKYLLICINVRKQATWIYFIYKSWLSSIWRYICYGDCALADLIFFMTTDLYMTVVIMTLSAYLIKYNISFYDNQLIFLESKQCFCYIPEASTCNWHSVTGLSSIIRARRERKTNTTCSIENEVNVQCIQWPDFHIEYWRVRQELY